MELPSRHCVFRIWDLGFKTPEARRGLSTGLSSQDFAGDDKTILQAESARGSINRPRIGGGKGGSQQVSLVPFSVANFRVADDTPGIPRATSAHGASYRQMPVGTATVRH
jgi:hypothetical protein